MLRSPYSLQSRAPEGDRPVDVSAAPAAATPAPGGHAQALPQAAGMAAAAAESAGAEVVQVRESRGVQPAADHDTFRSSLRELPRAPLNTVRDDRALSSRADGLAPVRNDAAAPARPAPVQAGAAQSAAAQSAAAQSAAAQTASVRDAADESRRDAPVADGAPRQAAAAPRADAKAKSAGRPKPGERRVQILQTLAAMLQEPGSERVTTAALAKRLNVSEAALYRHFASKAQMFEGLIDFIERTVFSLINQITAQEHDALRQLRTIIGMLLAFAEKNPGMSRVLVGEALVNEDARLQARINQITDRLETALKQAVRNAVGSGKLPQHVDAGARANLILAFVLGRWLRFAKSGFKRRPTEGIEQMIAALVS